MKNETSERGASLSVNRSALAYSGGGSGCFSMALISLLV